MVACSDLGFDYCMIAESFETSVRWSLVPELCSRVKQQIQQSCEQRGIDKTFISCRVTQAYDTGACVYFYFAYNFVGIEHPAEVYEEIEKEARDMVVQLGGSLSHHHGIGKIRKHWMQDAISQSGVEMLRGMKQSIDPQHIFGSNNVIP